VSESFQEVRVDDLRIGSPGFVDSLFGETKDGSKKRPRRKHDAPEEEPEDVVALHSSEDEEEPPPEYLPSGAEKI
jgi:hypothetical protein